MHYLFGQQTENVPVSRSLVHLIYDEVCELLEGLHVVGQQTHQVSGGHEPQSSGRRFFSDLEIDVTSYHSVM